MKKKIMIGIIFFASLILISIATASLVTHLSNTVTATVTIIPQPTTETKNLTGPLTLKDCVPPIASNNYGWMQFTNENNERTFNNAGECIQELRDVCNSYKGKNKGQCNSALNTANTDDINTCANENQNTNEFIECLIKQSPRQNTKPMSVQSKNLNETSKRTKTTSPEKNNTTQINTTTNNDLNNDSNNNTTRNETQTTNLNNETEIDDEKNNNDTNPVDTNSTNTSSNTTNTEKDKESDFDDKETDEDTNEEEKETDEEESENEDEDTDSENNNDKENNKDDDNDEEETTQRDGKTENDDEAIKE